MRIAIFTAIFLVSLQSLYSSTLGLPIYSVIGAILLIALAALRQLALSKSERLRVPAKYRIQLLAPILLLFTSLPASFFSGDMEISRIFAFIIISSVPLSYILLSSYVDPVKISAALVLPHSSILLIQVILFYIFGIDFDPVSVLSDVQQRGWGGMQEHEILGGFRRLGGLHSEPGTFATFVAPLVALIFLQNEDTRSVNIGFFGVISLFFTFSLYAWIFSLIILAVKFAKFKLTSLLFLPLFWSMYQLALPYIKFRFINRSGGNGIDFRIEILDSILNFNIESLSNFLFGSGLLSIKIPFEYDGAINDVGLLPYMLLTGGIISVLIMLATIFDACGRLQITGIAIGLILLFSKISITAPMFWMILIITHHFKTQKYNYMRRQNKLDTGVYMQVSQKK